MSRVEDRESLAGPRELKWQEFSRFMEDVNLSLSGLHCCEDFGRYVWLSASLSRWELGSGNELFRDRAPIGKETGGG